MTRVINSVGMLLQGIGAWIQGLGDELRRCPICGRNPYDGKACRPPEEG